MMRGWRAPLALLFGLIVAAGPAAAEDLMTLQTRPGVTLSASPHKDLIAFTSGSTPQSEPGEALSRHGHIGLEREVVGAIAAWIKAKG
jgi:hypothetical protein